MSDPFALRPLSPIELKCVDLIQSQDSKPSYDPSHDFLHFIRVRNMCVKLAKAERDTTIRYEVLLPAAWLHDLNAPEKNSPLRSQGSRISAKAAIQQLRDWGYDQAHFEAIAHAIEAHSFSAAIPPQTHEARILQDADRLDAIGAIGMLRCFSVGGRLNRTFYDLNDPFASARPPADGQYTLDHFYQKLFKLPGLMQTEAGKTEAHARIETLKIFIHNLSEELFIPL